MQAVGRERTIRGYHLDIMDGIRFTSQGMPALDPCTEIPDDLLPFNYVPGGRESRLQGVHFFIDDYQFERVWRDPMMYGRMIEEYEAVLTPDFSLYTDMPLPMQRWNCYRSRFVGAVWQHMGLNVIPTLQWADVDSYKFAFDGLPEHSTIAVTAVGTRANAYSRLLWGLGMSEALERLHPETVLVYGHEPDDFNWGETPHITYTNRNIRRLKWVDEEHHQAEAAQVAAEAAEHGPRKERRMRR